MDTERFRTLSPLDHRYYFANREMFEQLSCYLSEEAAVRYSIRVETALLTHLVRYFLSDNPKQQEYLHNIAGLETRITAAEVYAEEEKTKHHVRAVVNVMQRHVPKAIRSLVHLGATSYDIIDTAAALRYKDACWHVVLPVLIQLQTLLIRLAEQEADRVCIARTHGQHAVPTTMGFVFAEYAARFGGSVTAIAHAGTLLCGKMSGAVGSYNAFSMFHPDPVAFEAAVLAELGTQAGEHSTQIVSPEPLLNLFLAMNTAFGILANLADDIRNLQRSEIGELQEYFATGQVGSSTMPHKRNPWNAEHVKSLWKTFFPRSLTWFMDQISEHQRDLSNSASARFLAEYVAGFAAAADRMKCIIERIQVDVEGVQHNLTQGAASVMAEPLYILLAASGNANAHERIRQLTLQAKQQQKPIVEIVRQDSALWQQICMTYHKLTGKTAEEFFSDAANYTGRAAEQTHAVCAQQKQVLKHLKTNILQEANNKHVSSYAAATAGALFSGGREIDNTALEEGSICMLQFQKRGGLLPVIVQDSSSHHVLMLAYANKEALAQTLKTGQATFWSSSRNALWEKGKSSGNTMQVQSVLVDCDQDALIYQVIPKGGACHTTDNNGNARTSCFYRFIDASDRLSFLMSKPQQNS